MSNGEKGYFKPYMQPLVIYRDIEPKSDYNDSHYYVEGTLVCGE